MGTPPQAVSTSEPPEAMTVASFANVIQPGSGGEIIQVGPESDGSRGDKGDRADGSRQGCSFRAAGAGRWCPTDPWGASWMGLHGGKGGLVTHGAAGLGWWGAHGRGIPRGPVRGALGSLCRAPRWKQEQKSGQQ